jgi:hypothetical protein
MPTYLCKWPDGTGTLISCRDEDALFLALDLEGDPGAAIYKEIENYVSIRIKVIKEDEADESTDSLVEFLGYNHQDDPLGKRFNDPADWKRLK